ncbi:MAG: NAD-dependent deacylase [Candidatus Heimdallarchaeota archaeon]|nr:NAD-dependent deacylase [Candidatus Heimdallarchaeota archaeon]
MYLIEEAVKLIKQSKNIVAFTGAGISVESGIPPFRGPDGLWSKYDMELLEIEYFYSHPKEAWEFVTKIFLENFVNAHYNPAHFLLSHLEQNYGLSSVITQNIDNLHQEAGSKNVIEFHGNCYTAICTQCTTIVDLIQYLNADMKNYKQDVVIKIKEMELPLRCKTCNAVLKPDIVFFGEGISEIVTYQSAKNIIECDLLIIIGTTGLIMPAAAFPYFAKEKGIPIIEINPERTPYTDQITDVFLQDKAGIVANRILESLKKNQS